jgi:hypothetical protein
MKKILIGIDPDVEKNGFAIYFLETKILELYKLDFFKIFEYLKTNKKNYHIKVIVDAGWLNKSNFHVIGINKRVNGKIGEKVGANHQVGKLLIEMCNYLGVEVFENKPTKSKLNHETFVKITGYAGRTCQEKRDAGMLVYGKKF